MKRARPVTISLEAFAAIRYALTRQLNRIASPSCPYTQASRLIPPKTQYKIILSL